jgi:hypothetical protein
MTPEPWHLTANAYERDFEYEQRKAEIHAAIDRAIACGCWRVAITISHAMRMLKNEYGKDDGD